MAFAPVGHDLMRWTLFVYVLILSFGPSGTCLRSGRRGLHSDASGTILAGRLGITSASNRAGGYGPRDDRYLRHVGNLDNHSG